MSTIFNQSVEGKVLAREYTVGAQEDIGLEWLGRHSQRIAVHVAYLRVTQGSNVACLSLNELLGVIFEEEERTFDFSEDDEVSVESIRALHAILTRDPYAEERIVESLAAAIVDEKIEGDGRHLVNIENL